MSGGGGGIIIIRNLVKPVADSDTVKDYISPARRIRLQEILQKPVEDWTDEEFHFLLRCIAHAHDESC